MAKVREDSPGTWETRSAPPGINGIWLANGVVREHPGLYRTHLTGLCRRHEEMVRSVAPPSEGNEVRRDGISPAWAGCSPGLGSAVEEVWQVRPGVA